MTGARWSTGDSHAANRGYDDRLRVLLRECGLRCTPTRMAVLHILARRCDSGHSSAAQIHRLLHAGGHDADVTTVYRTIATLVDVGVVHALSVDERTTTFGMADRPHHHAVCTRCGTLSEVPADRLSDALDHARTGSSFDLSDTAGLILRGLCPNCQVVR